MMLPQLWMVAERCCCCCPVVAGNGGCGGGTGGGGGGGHIATPPPQLNELTTKDFRVNCKSENPLVLRRLPSSDSIRCRYANKLDVRPDSAVTKVEVETAIRTHAGQRLV